MRKIKVLLWMAACFLLACHVTSVKAAGSFTGEESYKEQSLADLYQSHDMEFVSDGVGDISYTEYKISGDDGKETVDGILVTGNASVINEGSFQIKKEFHFDSGRVGRVAVDALAAKGENLTIHLYLDDQTESFASIKLQKQGREGLWTKDVSLSADVLSDNIRGTHSISFRVENTDGGQTAVLLRSIEFVESQCPTIYLDIDESLGNIEDMNISKDHSKECYGDMRLEIPEGYSYEFGSLAGQSATNDIMETYPLSYIRGRGNITWVAGKGKNPYKIKLQEAQNLLGMGANKHWALIANYFDNSRVRNQITYWVGRQLGLEYTPECVSVDVVMNGVYYGNYMLTETIRVDENRVDIGDGYLLSVNSASDSDGEGDESDKDSTTAATFTTNKLSLSVESPSIDSTSDQSVLNNIKNYVLKTENALYGSNFKDANGKSYTDYMDLDSAVDYYLMQEISMNTEAFKTSSTYLYQKKDGKLYWGPLWDFDNTAWNGSWDSGTYKATGFIDNDVAWFAQMLKDSVFTSRLASRWPEFKSKLLEACKDGGQIDKYYDQMTVALRYEEEKYGMYDWESQLKASEENTIPAGIADIKTYNAEKERLKAWMKSRVQWMDENIDILTGQKHKISLMADGKLYKTLYVNGTLGVLPSAPAKSGYFFQGWNVCDSDGHDTGTFADTTAKVTGDMILNASYVSSKNVVVPQKLYLSKNMIYAKDSDDGESNVTNYQLYASVYPESAVGHISYSSDNIKVATVDQNGLITLVACGKAKISVTCAGLTKSCTVVYLDDSSEAEVATDENISISSTLSLKKGQWQQLAIHYSEDYPDFEDYQWLSMNTAIATVDQCGVVSGKKNGSTTIVLTNKDGTIVLKCKVTVGAVASTIKKGYTYTYKGLKYKVTSKATKGGTVTVLGPTGKKIRSVNIRSTLTIKGETFKVTGISYKAFYKCKKLRKIYLGKNLKSIGNKAFSGIYKKARFRVPASKKKAYKKLLTSRKGFKKKTMKIYQ